MRLVVIAAIACAGALNVGSARSQPAHYALLIANTDYARESEWPDLATPARDVDALSRVLEDRYGFHIRRVENATRADMVNAIEDMRAEVDEDDSLLIYYAGHGTLRENDGGYWVGVDGSANRSADWLKYDVINDLIDYRSGMRARHVLVIADSCFSGAALRSQRESAVPDGETRADLLSRRFHSRSRRVMTSGGTEPVIDSIGGAGHSVFAVELLEKLQTNSGMIDAFSLFQQIEPEVFGRARRVLGERAQAPEFGQIDGVGHDGGDFVFIPAGLVAPEPETEGSSTGILGFRGPTQVVFQIEGPVHLGDEEFRGPEWAPVAGACYDASFEYTERIDYLTLTYDIFGAENTFVSFNGIVQSLPAMHPQTGSSRPNYWQDDQTSIISVGGEQFEESVVLRICAELVPDPDFGGDLDDFQVRNIQIRVN